MSRARRDMDMTQGVIWKQLLYFAAPLALGLLFQQLYNTVDTIVVGRFVGREALAAVGSTSSIINMMVGFGAGMSTGASVTIAQCYGAKDHKTLSRAVHTTMAFTLILGVIATALGLLLVDPMLRLMDTPQDVFEQAHTYLMIYYSGMLGLLIYNMGSGILRAVGDSRRPLYFLCFSALMNTVLDLLFVLVFHMGVAGVAYATIIAQFLSALLVLWVLCRDHAPYGLRIRHIKIHWDMLKRIFGIGFPAAIQQVVTSFSNVFVQSYINFFGSASMAGWSTYNKLDAFLLIPVQAIAIANTTFVGQNYGAKKMDRARKGVMQAQLISVGITMVLAGMTILFARNFIHLFSSDPEVVQYGVYFITLISPFYFLMCIYQNFAGALRGVGSATQPMVIMLLSFVVIRQIYLYLVRYVFGNPLAAVALSYPVGWVICSVLLTVCYKRSVLGRKALKSE
ncbi:MAG: MATE family efflux transporter [Clostridiales bacterium]|nr:MATE family efflux transporter [Clostridiales bacterium]